MAAGAFALIGFGVENDTPALVTVAAAPFVAMALLFHGWRSYNQTIAREVTKLIGRDSLAQNLSRRPTGQMVSVALGAAVALVAAGVGWQVFG